MSFHPPQLYAITDAQLSGLSHADQVACLAAGGATLVQLREKHLPSDAFCKEAKQAIEIARRLNVQIIINDRVDIAMLLHADGVHLGQGDLHPLAARELLGPSAIIGLSVHNTGQAKKALGLPIDYLAAGPIFPTQSKDNPDPILGLEGMRRIRREIGTLPLVAIGGINRNNIGSTIENGADSVAMIGALLAQHQSIESTTQSILHVISALNRK